MSKVSKQPSTTRWFDYVHVAFALLFCVLNLAIASVPVVGMALLPCLFGSACWATAALERARLIQ